MPSLQPPPVPASAASTEFPDDPRKWDGWSKYLSDNAYERLCLDARSNPGVEQIQENCRALLQWWQRKRPLKNQPSNPLTQLLGRGIDDAARFLVQARMQLLDPERRRQIDREVAAAAQEQALAEFARYVAFSIAGGVLTVEAESNLTEFGQRNGLADEQINRCIDEEILRTKAKRASQAVKTAERENPVVSREARDEFIRILRLTDINMGSATYDVRRLIAAVAQNLGIDHETGEDLLDHYLEAEELALGKRVARSAHVPVQSRVAAATPAPPVANVLSASAPNETDKPPGARRAPNFVNPLGGVMLLIPAGEFLMGSDAIDAAPNEQPVTPVRLSEFYMSRHPVTNAQYEQFDRSHRQKRMNRAGDHHPVVYVTSHEAVKFCQWLAQKDGRKYRLPTEAEWEYAARGTDGRKYPWGNDEARGDVANFADASTSFAWRDPQVSDGYAELSPVGAFPAGASSFGLEDMAGNVWEWCLDFLQPLPGTPKENPRGPLAGSKRIYRGGSWKSRFSNLRASARGSNAPNYSCNDLGFRIVCEGVRGESA